ncbi:MAG: DNA translocase FtsK [Neisseriaceae bacterium]
MLGKANNAKFAKKNRETILPAKTALLVNYIVAVGVFALAFIFAILLVTYNPTDNCWFKTSDSNILHNKLGAIGAYFSDFILSIFGFSGWWLVLGLFYLGYRKIIRNKIESGDWYTIFQAICFIFLIFFSSVFEYINFINKSSGYLHNGFGGLLGHAIYPILSFYLGQLGTVALTLILAVTCFSFTFSVSLGNIAEKIGFILDFFYMVIVKLLSHDEKVENKSDTDDTGLATSPSIKIPKFFKKENTSEYKFSDNNDILSPEDDGFDALFQKLSDNNIDNKIANSKAKQNPSGLLWDKKTNLDLNEDNDLNEDYILPSSSEGELSYYDENTKFDEVKEDASNDNQPIENRVIKFTNKPRDFTVGKIKSLPTTDLLNPSKKQIESITSETLEYVSNSIENKLLEFGVEAKIVEAQSGPVVTRYELLPSRGVRGEKIVGLGKEIARGLALSNVRIVETIPGKNTMGIEVPNYKRQVIYLKDLFDSVVFKNSISKLTLALGRDIAGQVIVADLAKMPHLLVAGTTGSGKSVAINTMILSFLFQATADEVKFIMIDPKMVELSFYQDIPHLLAPVITDSNYAVNALKWTVAEMEKRYRIMAKVGCKNISTFNQKIDEAENMGKSVPNPISLTPDEPEPLAKWPYIVVIVDELADLMMSSGKKVEQYIVRIAQKARAVGIHLILATQRPSVDVITGLIKANVPSRISFQVTSKVDSRTVLDQGGAETLLGQGDMLYLQPGAGVPVRIHGAFVNDDEINRIVDFLKASGSPEYIEEILSGEVSGAELPGLDDSGDNPEKDSMFDEAVKFIYDTKRCSISSLQTRFGIGYNRAARIMSHLETIGMVRRNERGGFELLKTE